MRESPLTAAEALQASIDKNIILDICVSNNSSLVHIETANEPGQPSGEPWATMTAGSKKTRIRRASHIVKCVNLHDELIKLLESVVSDYEGETDIGFDQTIINIKNALEKAKDKT